MTTRYSNEIRDRSHRVLFSSVCLHPGFASIFSCWRGGWYVSSYARQKILDDLGGDTSADEKTQAHRIITQVVFTGARVFGRAFAEAYKQASASQKFAAANQNNPAAANTLSSSGLTLDEACKILNVPPPQGAQTNLTKVHEQFKHLFDMNDPKKGGSFYLQSKVLRARERIELEVRKAEERVEREEELKGGWRPKVYKDR